MVYRAWSPLAGHCAFFCPFYLFVHTLNNTPFAAPLFISLSSGVNGVAVLLLEREKKGLGEGVCTFNPEGCVQQEYKGRARTRALDDEGNKGLKERREHGRVRKERKTRLGHHEFRTKQAHSDTLMPGQER
jgi:hypothetical protein